MGVRVALITVVPLLTCCSNGEGQPGNSVSDDQRKAICQAALPFDIDSVVTDGEPTDADRAELFRLVTEYNPNDLGTAPAVMLSSPEADAKTAGDSLRHFLETTCNLNLPGG